MHQCGGCVVERDRIRCRSHHRLDIGGIAGLDAPHEGVLTDLALGQELLRRTAAHRTEVADTMTYLTPSRSKIFWYASRCRLYETLRPSSSRSKE